VAAVELDDGSRVDCDMVVLGIGVMPHIELARAAGLAISDGIDVEADGRTCAKAASPPCIQ
jgi:3-phenylpropionate/trans-cinnamate dioxygenase ferredoxin reductase subunit